MTALHTISANVQRVVQQQDAGSNARLELGAQQTRTEHAAPKSTAPAEPKEMQPDNPVIATAAADVPTAYVASNPTRRREEHWIAGGVHSTGPGEACAALSKEAHGLGRSETQPAAHPASFPSETHTRRQPLF